MMSLLRAAAILGNQ